MEPRLSDEELVKRMIAIVIINTWNRFAITFRPAKGGKPGSYQPDHFVTLPKAITEK